MFLEHMCCAGSTLYVVVLFHLLILPFRAVNLLSKTREESSLEVK